jgi:hypothetical protein
MWNCRICGWNGEIPDNAIELARPRRHRLSYLYRFADGTVHDLRRVKPELVAAARRVELLPEPPTIQQTELVEVLAEPQSEPVNPLTESETEDDEALTLTPMQMAFSRRKQFQN